MAFTSIPSADIATGKPLKQGLFQNIKDNDDYLAAQVAVLQSMGGIPNGSLEVDSDADGVPDTWSWSAFNGGTKAADPFNFVMGTKSLKITRQAGAAYGGGTITSDYVECSFLETLNFGIAFKSTSAGVVNAVYVRYYDASKIEIATQNWYVNGTGRQLWRKDGSMPLDWTWLRILNVGVPLGVRYYKFAFAGGLVDASNYAAADINVDRIISGPNALGYSSLPETIEHAEGNVTSNSWADVGATYSITVPSGKKYLSVRIKMTRNTADILYARAAIGSTYGTTVTTGPDPATVVYGDSVIDVSTLSGARTLKFQSYVETSGTGKIQSSESDCQKSYTPLSITVDSYARIVTETI